MRSVVNLLVCLGLSAFATLGCAEADRPARANLLFVSIDTIRYDHTSLSGYARPTTPHLAELAAEGVHFDAAYAPMGTTGPSHASMFTGLYPRQHGVVKNSLTLGPRLTTLAEVLQANGYATAAYLSALPLGRRFGLAQGFDHYDEPSAQTSSTPTSRTASEIALLASAWLEARPLGRPFFLWVHVWDPHHPYSPPEDLARRFRPESADPSELEETLAAYDAEIAAADRGVGRLVETLDALGLREETLVAIVGDHGEGLMQHGVMGHGPILYEEIVRVPLVLRWPGRLPEGRVVAEPVSLVDLVPTILALLGVQSASIVSPGVSLVPALDDEDSLDPERPIFVQRRHYARNQYQGVSVQGPRYAVRVGRWKYIEVPSEGTEELYDLILDPGEARDVSQEKKGVARKLARALAQWRIETIPLETDAAPISEADRRALESLGYVP